MQIALVPLDERPVNTRYPQMIGAIAGARVLLPPAESLGLQREPADLVAVADWLRDLTARRSVDAVIVSCDFLAFGNLINSRISDDSAAVAVSRLALLEEIGALVPVFAFSLITRVSNADDDVEEPRYWKEWGTKFYEFARLSHRHEAAQLDERDRSRLAELSGILPQSSKADWLIRRLRNQSVNLALMDMAARGRIASLLLTSDDTSAFGFPTRERDWLSGWIELIGEPAATAIQMHPGADEVGSALVASVVNSARERPPRVWVDYAIEADSGLVAPYEDLPVRETVAGQIEACGCTMAATPDDCDFVLGVVTPCPKRADYRPEFLEQDRSTRTEPYRQFLLRLAQCVDAGQPVAFADVAYPNGSDPLMSEMLLDAGSLLRAGSLAAYGAWNTAGNTLGTVIAQASCRLESGRSPERTAAQQAFLAHRFLEDYGYQQRVRREAREFADSNWGRREPAPDSLSEQQAVCRFIEARLSHILTELQQVGVGEGLSFVADSVRLPWRRTFEVDFELR